MAEDPFEEMLRRLIRDTDRMEQESTRELEQPVDNGQEGTTEDWICDSRRGSRGPLDYILQFLQLYFVQQQIAAGEDVNSNVIKNIRKIQIHTMAAPSSTNTSINKLIGIRAREKWDVVTLLEFKRWSLTTRPQKGPVMKIIDQAVKNQKTFEDLKLDMDQAWFQQHVDDEQKIAAQTAVATVGQVFEQLCNDGKGYILSPGARLLLTGVYGHQYHVVYDRTEQKLFWSTNLASQSLNDAGTNKELRNSPEVNQEIVDYFFNAIFKDMPQAILRWKTPIPAPAHQASRLLRSVRTMLPGFYAPFLVMAFHLTSVVLSEMIDPLEIETSWPRLPIFGLYLNLRILRIGNNVIWGDTEAGVVFKQFFTADQYNRELGFYHRLAHLPWIPTVLAAVSTEGRWGIFTSFAGSPIPSSEWEEAVPTLKCWVKELHSLGVHHHDLACRNVLKGADGSLTLIDFDRAVESTDCDPLDCSDLYVDEPLDY